MLKVTVSLLFAALIAVATSSGQATERARGATRRVLGHAKRNLAARVSDPRIVTVANALLRPTQPLRMHRSYIGKGAWENRVRKDGGRELYWQSCDRKIRDVRVIEEKPRRTRFIAERGGNSTVRGYLAADGAHAVLSERVYGRGQIDRTKRLVMDQLSPTRVAVRFEERDRLGRLRDAPVRGVVRFAAPVSLHRLTVGAVRKAHDYLAAIDTASYLPAAVDESSGKRIKLWASKPWTGLMLNGCEQQLARTCARSARRRQAGPTPHPIDPDTAAEIAALWDQCCAF